MLLSAQEWSATWLSLLVAGCATLAAMPLAVACGYVLARGRWRGKWLLETIVNLPLVLPPVVTGYVLLVLLSPRGAVGRFVEQTFGVHIAFTWLGAVIAAAIMALPLMVRAVRVAVAGVDARLESAARTLGAGPIDVLVTITLPLAWRGVVGGAALGFGRALGEFGATIMLAGNIAGQTQTIPLAIYSLAQRPGGYDQTWRLVAAAVALAVITLAVAEWLERKGGAREPA